MNKVVIYYQRRCGNSRRLREALRKDINIYGESLTFIDVNEWPDEAMEDNIKATPTVILTDTDGGTLKFVGYSQSLHGTIKRFLDKECSNIKEVLN